MVIFHNASPSTSNIFRMARSTASVAFQRRLYIYLRGKRQCIAQLEHFIFTQSCGIIFSTVLTMILLCTYITTFFSLSTFNVAFRIFAVTSACMILLDFPEKHLVKTLRRKMLFSLKLSCCHVTQCLQVQAVELIKVMAATVTEQKINASNVVATQMQSCT